MDDQNNEFSDESAVAEFTNDAVLLSDIPKIESIQYEPLQKPLLYANYTIIGVFFGIILMSLCIAVLFVDFIRNNFFYFLPGTILLFLFFFFAEWREFPLRGFAIRQHDLLIKKGWLWRSTSIIPFNRIQHIHYEQGPIDRLFDLASLSVHTAGETSAHELAGLSPDQAMKLKEYIMKYSQPVDTPIPIN